MSTSVMPACSALHSSRQVFTSSHIQCIGREHAANLCNVMHGWDSKMSDLFFCKTQGTLQPFSELTSWRNNSDQLDQLQKEGGHNSWHMVADLRLARGAEQPRGVQLGVRGGRCLPLPCSCFDVLQCAAVHIALETDLRPCTPMRSPTKHTLDSTLNVRADLLDTKTAGRGKPLWHCASLTWSAREPNSREC